jgi:hypothetical protein
MQEKKEKIFDTPEEASEFRKRLLEIKKNRFNNSNRKVAYTLDVGMSSVLRWFSNDQNLPSIKALMRISKITGLSLDYIMFGKIYNDIDKAMNDILNK